MEQNNKYIEELLERFFEGETSNDEERELYAFFRQPEIPAHLEQYRSVFGWFDKGLEEEVKVKTGMPVLALRPNRKNRIIWTAVAAAVVIAFLMLPLSKPAEVNPYEGSYIVVNGEKITDPAIVGPEVEATLQWLEQEETYRQKKALEEYLISEILWTMEAEAALQQL